jgi:hypothetical protein
MLVRLEAARDGKHKWIAHFANGRKTRFGDIKYEDYTQHRDMERRRLYRLRNAKHLDTRDPYRAGYLSYWILWNTTDIDTNVREYNKRFFGGKS